MKTLSAIVLSLSLLASVTVATAAPSKATVVAKQHVDAARAELKAARAHDRAKHKTTAKARKIAKLRARLQQLESGTPAPVSGHVASAEVETDPSDY